METKKESFWTFSVKKLEISRNEAVVEGWFIVCNVEVVSNPSTGGIPTKVLTFNYLTPESRPVVLDLRSFLAPTLKIEEINPKAVVDALEAVFKTPYKQVPKAPLDVPLHKIPPSRRKKMEENLRKKEGRLGTPPEEDIGM